MREVPDYLRIARRAAGSTGAGSIEQRPGSEDGSVAPEYELNEVNEQSPAAEEEVRRLVREGAAENVARFEVFGSPDNGHNPNCLCGACLPPARSEKNGREEKR